jgi:CubicO group peptidase (beta-lactamase class C family)
VTPRRWVIRAASVLILLIAGTAFVFGFRLLSIGTAFKAKMLCSEVFVAGRPPEDVLADTEIDDLKPLWLVDANVDWMSRTSVATSLFGAIEYHAQFRGDAGCSLAFDGAPKPGVVQVPRSPVNAPANGLPDAPADPRSAEDGHLASLLDAAFSEPDPQHLRRTRAILIVQDGRIVGERYAAGVGPGTPFLGWSMTKSVLNALVGILIKEGRLSLGGSSRLEAWSAPGDARAGISLDHLLHMSSGLRFAENTANPLSDVTAMLLQTADMADFAARMPLEVKPGTRWQYSSGTSVIIAGLMRNVLGDQEYRRFPRSALFEPIGMGSAVLETDASGTFIGSSFMYATARDWARFGMLYLQDGIWNGRRILPEGWVEYTRKPAPADRRSAYGAHVWLRIPSEYNEANAILPPDAFHAVGHEGQFVTIIPSRRTVIVRLGKTRYPHAWDQGAFVKRVLDALRTEEPSAR